MAKTKAKRTWAKITIALLLFLFFLTSKNSAALPTFESNKPDVILADITKYLNNSGYKFVPKKEYSQWWISDDGWNITLPDTKDISTNINPCAPKDSCKKLTQSTQTYAHLPKAMDLNDKLTKVFLVNGFTKNKKNSSKSLDDKSLYDYVLAFQKGETRCTLVTNADMGTSQQSPEVWEIPYDISCSVNFSDNYKTQLPYQKALALYKKYDDKNVVALPYYKNGDFESVGVHSRRTGFTAIMKKVGDNYVVLMEGQQPPGQGTGDCDALLKNGAPLSYCQ